MHVIIQRADRPTDRPTVELCTASAAESINSLDVGGNGCNCAAIKKTSTKTEMSVSAQE